jgi:hypothetical protein
MPDTEWAGPVFLLETLDNSILQRIEDLPMPLIQLAFPALPIMLKRLSEA